MDIRRPSSKHFDCAEWIISVQFGKNVQLYVQGHDKAVPFLSAVSSC